MTTVQQGQQSISVQPAIFVQQKLGNFNTLLSEYELIGKKLGEGTFGSVEVVQLRGTSQQRAMKKVDKQSFNGSMSREDLMHEISILKSLDHPNILKIYEFYEDKRYLYIITELCTGIELYDAIINRENNETFSEQETMKIIQQALSALQYAHALYYTHRDIKPENIMIQPETMKIKIIDWGTSTSFKGEKINKFVGSAYYIAPEIVKNKAYDERVDIWSLGVIMYFLLAGNPPFDSDKTAIVLKDIATKKVTYDEAVWSKVSKECSDLNQRMLTSAPSKRISASQALQHPWFSIASPSKVRQKLLNDKLKALKTFQYRSQLQMATIQYVASHLMSQTEKDELSDLFVHLDANKDGRLSRQEIINGYSKLHGQEEAELIVEKIFSEVDVDNSGTIDYNEFLASTMNQQKLMSQTTLKRAFSLFDVDGDEQITAEEIRNVLQSNVDQFDSEIWENMIKEVDKDGNGVIDFQEFCSMMESLVKEADHLNKSQDKLNPFHIVTRSRAILITEEQENSNNFLNVNNGNAKNPEIRTTPTRSQFLSVPEIEKSPRTRSMSASNKDVRNGPRTRKEVFSSVEEQQEESFEHSPRKIFKKK